MQKRKCAGKIRAPEEIRVKGKPSPASMSPAIGLNLPCMAEMREWMDGEIRRVDGLVMWMPNIENAAIEDSAEGSSPATQADDCAQDRRRFFGTLNAMRSRLERHGVSVEDVRRCYAKRFGVEGMSHCSQGEWAIAAAEVQAMFYSPEIFSNRIAWIREQGSSDSGGE